MKKDYIKPSSKLFSINLCDVVCASLTDADVSENPIEDSGDVGARGGGFFDDGWEIEEESIW